MIPGLPQREDGHEAVELQSERTRRRLTVQVREVYDVEIARAIAAVVRESGGGFPGVRALGLALPSAGHAQVSMNVEDYEAAALHDILERVEAEALARGTEISGSELVGLMPAGAAVAAAGRLLRIDGFDASHVLELQLLGHTEAQG